MYPVLRLKGARIMLGRFVLLLVLLLPVCQASDGSFELTDPAAQFFEEEQKPPVPDGTVDASYPDGLRCTVDTGTAACTCVDKAEGLKVEMEAGQCETLVRSVLDRKDSG
jgi:hypothetical protein